MDNLLRVEMNNEIAEEFFNKFSKDKGDAEKYLLEKAKEVVKEEGYIPVEYEMNNDEKKVAVLYKKEGGNDVSLGDEGLEKEEAKDKRPPKDWWDNCIARAKRFADDPERFCGALWYNPDWFPHGEKLRKSFGKPYKGSIIERVKMLKEAAEYFNNKMRKESKGGKKEEKNKKISLWDRIAFWRKKKGVDEEAMKTDYRTKEERGHPDYSTEGKGEGKWEDFRISRYSEASLKDKIAMLKRRIAELRREIREAEVEDDRIYEKIDEERGDDFSKDFVYRRLKEKVSNLKRKISEKQEADSLRKRMMLRRARLERLLREKENVGVFKESSVSGLAKLSSLRNRLLRKIESLKRKLSEFKVGYKKKAVFDPRILTDLSPEVGFGPHPEIADEVGERRREYKVELAHEKSEEVKKPIPETSKMVAEKPAEVEKAFIEKASKVVKIVDKMIDKGIISEAMKYQKINDLLKFNDFELNRIDKYVDEVKSENVLVIDEQMIDLEKIIGD